MTAQYLLPQPPKDPITLLNGHGDLDQTWSAACEVSVDFDETFTRIGD
jgi:hypothetical protein